MKWPASVMLIRHDTSAYNILKDKKNEDALYQEFLRAWREDPASHTTQALAAKVREKFSLKQGDAKTPLADKEGRQAYETGLALAKIGAMPDVIFVSPYKRAKDTLAHIRRGWAALASVKTFEEERVREQEHGLALRYNDWRVFQALNPEQRELRELEGPYWYRYPQGENVPDVRARNRSFLTTLTRDWTERRVLIITHHLNILAMRANLERLSATRFIHLDESEKPINCGVTLYRGYPKRGADGRLVLEFYNKKYYR